MLKRRLPHLALIKPNFVHIDSTSSAAGSTWFSMQMNPTLTTLINLELLTFTLKKKKKKQKKKKRKKKKEKKKKASHQ